MSMSNKHCKVCDTHEPQDHDITVDGLWQCECAFMKKDMTKTAEDLMSLIDKTQKTLKDRLNH